MAKRCHSLICQRPARYLTLNEGQQKHQLGKVLKSRYYCERNVFFSDGESCDVSSSLYNS